MTTMSPATSSDSDLAAIIQKYNEVTERLMRSQESLSGEVFRLRNALEEKNKELERAERLAALGEMAAGIAHEIRNPLGGIRLYASVLQRDLVDRPREQELVRRLDAGACNLEQIVGDVLAFAGGAEPDPREVTVGEILDASISQTAPRAQLRHPSSMGVWAAPLSNASTQTQPPARTRLGLCGACRMGKLET